MTTTTTAPSDPRSFGDELMHMIFDGRHRAKVRSRFMRLLDQRLAALTHATTDTEIARVEQDAQKLIEFSDVLLAIDPFFSLRDPTQSQKVKKKVADLKAELAARQPLRRLAVEDRGVTRTDQ